MFQLALLGWLVCSTTLVLGADAPVVVTISWQGDGWRMTRGGEPFVIQGVGGDQRLEALKAAGGNSIRTWSAEKLKPILDEAHRLGLTVTVGLWLGHERHGFNYNDADQVAAQVEAVRRAITQFKDHPAVLMWALGNEMEGNADGDNAAIWSAINNLAVLAKQLDPQHPTMTVIAEIGGQRVKNIHRLCPDVDVVGINSYGGGATIPKRYREAGGTKPYVLTEFGPPGMWETKKNDWGVALEPTSTEKATSYRATYAANVVGAKEQCLGSYAFVWGQKQEATATWFGMLLPDGSRTEAVDVLSELWTGRPPANRCPSIKSLTLTGPAKVEPLATIKASLDATDPERDQLAVEWVLQAEQTVFSEGGDAVAVPPTFPAAIVKSSVTSVEVKLPADGGGYRLFAFVRDGQGGAAVANVPLFVNAPVRSVPANKASLPFVLYDEDGRDKPPFVPTGWMGNAKAMKLDEACAIKPHSGQTCLKFDFSANDTWGGIVWQSPPNDWGDKPGGWNITGAKRLSFWARGEQGGEVASFELGLLGRDKKFADSGSAKLERVTLTTDWQQFQIDLSGKDLNRIKTGFAITVAGSGRPFTFYLDDVKYEAP